MGRKWEGNGRRACTIIIGGLLLLRSRKFGLCLRHIYDLGQSPCCVLRRSADSNWFYPLACLQVLTAHGTVAFWCRPSFDSLHQTTLYHCLYHVCLSCFHAAICLSCLSLL
jgi:hypothetical protein